MQGRETADITAFFADQISRLLRDEPGGSSAAVQLRGFTRIKSGPFNDLTPRTLAQVSRRLNRERRAKFPGVS